MKKFIIWNKYLRNKNDRLFPFTSILFFRTSQWNGNLLENHKIRVFIWNQNYHGWAWTRMAVCWPLLMKLVFMILRKVPELLLRLHINYDVIFSLFHINSFRALSLTILSICFTCKWLNFQNQGHLVQRQFRMGKLKMLIISNEYFRLNLSILS